MWRFRRLFGRRRHRGTSAGRKRRAFQPVFEPLEARRLLAVSAIFSAPSGVLSVFGDGADNTITVSRNAAGNILVNGGAVPIGGGTPTVANTGLVQVFGMSGQDTLSLDEANGALAACPSLRRRWERHARAAGRAADLLFGQAGVDILLGQGGADQLFGGAAADTLTGGDADDQSFGQNDDDRMVWNPGDDTDLNEGGAGLDTTQVNARQWGRGFGDDGQWSRVTV